MMYVYSVLGNVGVDHFEKFKFVADWTPDNVTEADLKRLRGLLNKARSTHKRVNWVAPHRYTKAARRVASMIPFVGHLMTPVHN